MQMLFMRENHPGVGYSLISRSFLLGWKHARLWCETRESSTHFAAVKFFLSICDVCDISDFPSLRANESKFWFNRGHLKQNTVMCIAYIKGYLRPCDASTTDHSFNVISHWWLMQGRMYTNHQVYHFYKYFWQGNKSPQWQSFSPSNDSSQTCKSESLSFVHFSCTTHIAQPTFLLSGTNLLANLETTCYFSSTEH